MRGKTLDQSNPSWVTLVFGRDCCKDRQIAVHTLIQCSTEPVLVSSVTSGECGREGAGNLAAKCILQYMKYNF